MCSRLKLYIAPFHPSGCSYGRHLYISHTSHITCLLNLNKSNILLNKTKNYNNISKILLIKLTLSLPKINVYKMNLMILIVPLLLMMMTLLPTLLLLVLLATLLKKTKSSSSNVNIADSNSKANAASLNTYDTAKNKNIKT